MLRIIKFKNLSIILVTATLVLLSCVVHSAKLYKYKDENGRWVFTDKKPAVKQFEAERLLVTERKAKVSIINRGTENRPVLVLVNQLSGPVEAWVDFKSTRNIRFSQAKPFRWVVEGPAEQVLLQFEPENLEAGWSYQWEAGFTLGKPQKGPPKNLSIGLPFLGGPHLVSQSFFGEASHTGYREAEYAVDITMPENTPIVAVADGVVMDTEKDFSRAGWGQQFADEANVVRLLHDDGTMSIYAHLAADGIKVQRGQRVKKGEVLAASGNTGYSSGPHLHFAMQMNEGKKLISFPFKFDGSNDEPTVGQVLLGPRVGRNSSRD